MEVPTTQFSVRLRGKTRPLKAKFCNFRQQGDAATGSQRPIGFAASIFVDTA